MEEQKKEQSREERVLELLRQDLEKDLYAPTRVERLYTAIVGGAISVKSGEFSFDRRFFEECLLQALLAEGTFVKYLKELSEPQVDTPLMKLLKERQ